MQYRPGAAISRARWRDQCRVWLSRSPLPWLLPGSAVPTVNDTPFGSFGTNQALARATNSTLTGAAPERWTCSWWPRLVRKARSPLCWCGLFADVRRSCQRVHSHRDQPACGHHV